MNITKLLPIGLLLATSFVSASETDNQTNIVSTSGFYLSYGQVSIDKDVAIHGGIDDSADYLKLGWEQHNNEWVWGAGLSAFLYDDNNGFTQRTQSTFGGEKNSKSSAEAFNLYLEGGYKYNVNENTHFILLAGYEHVLSSERGISNCSNCSSEDIDVDSGAYIQPRFTYQWDNNWFAALSHQIYLSGDADNSTFLTIGVNY